MFFTILTHLTYQPEFQQLWNIFKKLLIQDNLSKLVMGFAPWSYPLFVISVRCDALMLTIHSGDWIVIGREPRPRVDVRYMMQGPAPSVL